MNKDAIMAAIAFGSSKPGTVVEASVVQTTGTSATSVMSQKATTDALALKQNAADPAGLADNLTPYSADSGATQSVPFINQGTGCGNGESIVATGSYAQIKKKLGNTVAVNQQWDESKIPSDSALYSSNTYTANGVTFTKNGDGSITIQTDNGGATALTEVKIATGVTIPLTQKHLIRGAFGGSDSTYHINYAGGARKATDGSIFEPYTYGYNMWMSVESGAVITTPKKIYPQIIFLPLWFGSEGNIPSYLLSHPEDFGRYYSGSLAYNPGQLVNADGSVLTSIGRQMWDEEWEVGGYSEGTGDKNYFANRIRNKTPIKVIPNSEIYIFRPEEHYFYPLWYDASGNYVGASSSYVSGAITVPSNAHYLCFYLWKSGWSDPTYNHDVTISPYYSGESGYDQYYPFSVLAEVDTGSEVLRSAGAVADEKTPDGTITRRVGSVDMGTLTWTYVTNDGEPYFSAPISDKKIEPFNIQSGKYVVSSLAGTTNLPDKGIVGSGSVARVFVRDTAYTDASVLASALSGVYLNYQLATPTTEQGTAFAENIPCDDFGSLMWTQTKGIPQGNEIFYPVDYKASIDTLYNRVGGDMSRIVIDDDLNSYNTKTEDDAKFATKDAVGGTLRQLLAVSANINFADTTWVDLGTLTWTQSAGGAGKYYANLPEQYVIGATVNMLCSAYSFAGAQSTHYQTDKSFDCYSRSSASSPNQVYFRDDSISTVAGFTAAMKGQLLAYEKASS